MQFISDLIATFQFSLQAEDYWGLTKIYSTPQSSPKAVGHLSRLNLTSIVYFPQVKYIGNGLPTTYNVPNGAILFSLNGSKLCTSNFYVRPWQEGT